MVFKVFRFLIFVLVLFIFTACGTKKNISKCKLENVNSDRLLLDSINESKNNNSCGNNRFFRKNLTFCINHELNIDLGDLDLIVQLNGDIIYKGKYANKISSYVNVCSEKGYSYNFVIFVRDVRNSKSYGWWSDSTPRIEDYETKILNFTLLSDETIGNDTNTEYLLTVNEECIGSVR